MVKIFFGLFVLILLTSMESVAMAGSSQFEGNILNINKQTTEISEIEKGGYSCNIVGTAIEVRPKRGTTGVKKNLSIKSKVYIIPAGKKSASRAVKVKAGQQIIGKIEGVSEVTCTKNVSTSDSPPDTKTIKYPTVTVYGNSEK